MTCSCYFWGIFGDIQTRQQPLTYSWHDQLKHGLKEKIIKNGGICNKTVYTLSWTRGTYYLSLALPFYNKRYTCFLNSVGCLWHSQGKNPVRLYPKLQSQPIGLSKIFIDYLFFQADQSDCTKSVSIFNRFASSEERWNQNVPCQICRPWVFPLVV